MGKNNKNSNGYSGGFKRNGTNSNECGSDFTYKIYGGAGITSFANSNLDGRAHFDGQGNVDAQVTDTVSVNNLTTDNESGYFPNAPIDMNMADSARGAAYSASTYISRYKNMGKYQRAYNRRSRTALNKAESIWAAMIILMCFAICLCAVFLNGFTGLFAKKADINISRQKLFAVSGGTFFDVESARNSAQQIMAANGAGYIIKDNKQFSVLMSVYNKEPDALKVAENTGGSIYAMNIPALKLNTGLNKDENKLIKEALTAFSVVTENLISVSIKFDKKELGEAEVLAIVCAQRDMLFEYSVKIAPFKIDNTAKTARITDELEKTSNLLDSVSDINQQNSNSASAIRNCTIKVIYAQIRLFMEINSL